MYWSNPSVHQTATQSVWNQPDTESVSWTDQSVNHSLKFSPDQLKSQPSPNKADMPVNYSQAES